MGLDDNIKSHVFFENYEICKKGLLIFPDKPIRSIDIRKYRIKSRLVKSISNCNNRKHNSHRYVIRGTSSSALELNNCHQLKKEKSQKNE